MLTHKVTQRACRDKPAALMAGKSAVEFKDVIVRPVIIIGQMPSARPYAPEAHQPLAERAQIDA